MPHPILTDIRHQKQRICRRLKWRPGRSSKTIADADLVHWQPHNAMVRHHLKDAYESIDSALKSCREFNLPSTIDAMTYTNACINNAYHYNSFGLVVISIRQRGLIAKLNREVRNPTYIPQYPNIFNLKD